jgi:uncharacterized protein YutE (UPF0331/DUF86 family)
LGNSEFLFGTKLAKYDPFIPLDEQLEIKIVAGTRLLLVRGFSMKELEKFPEKIKNAIENLKISIQEQTKSQEEEEIVGIMPTARSNVRTVLEVIDELSKQFGNKIPEEEIIRKTKERGIENPEELIRKMLRERIILKITPTLIQKV